MAIPLPNTNNWGNFSQAFTGGVGAGSQMLQNMLREKQMQQQKEQFSQQQALRTKADDRAADMSPIQKQYIQSQIDRNEYAVHPERQMQMIQNFLSGGGAAGGGGNIPTKEMGQGMGMFTPGGMLENQQQKIQDAPKGNSGFNLSPEVIRRITIKKATGVDPWDESPQQKEKREIDTRTKSAQSIEQNKANVKLKSSLISELPIVHRRLKEVNNLIELSKKHPKWFGPGIGGYDKLGGPDSRERGINDEDYGIMKSLFGSLVAPQSQELSNKGLASALNFALKLKPGFGTNPKIVLGQLDQIKSRILSELKSAHRQAREVGADSGMVLLYKDGNSYLMPSNKADSALKSGFSYE